MFQGDIVDNIEKNVSQSVDHIVEAKEQTKKAVRYQTKARKVMSFFQLLLHFTVTSSSFVMFPTLPSTAFDTFKACSHTSPFENKSPTCVFATLWGFTLFLLLLSFYYVFAASDVVPVRVG